MKRFSIALVVVWVAAFAHAQSGPPSSSLIGVAVDQKLGNEIPLDLPFKDEAGRIVHFGDYFHRRPVVLALVYYQCPMLCNITLNQLTRSFNAMRETAGEQFEIVVVSFDPRETPELAAAKKEHYLRAYRRPTADQGWHFLTGDEGSIRNLTRAVGFNYRWDAAQQQFVHASAVMIISPDGKLTRYLLGVDYPPTELQSAVKAAGLGKVGPPADAVYFYCFRFDPATGKYGLIISRGLQAISALALVCVAGLIVSLHFVNARRTRQAVPR